MSEIDPDLELAAEFLVRGKKWCAFEHKKFYLKTGTEGNESIHPRLKKPASDIR